MCLGRGLWFGEGLRRLRIWGVVSRPSSGSSFNGKIRHFIKQEGTNTPAVVCDYLTGG